MNVRNQIKMMKNFPEDTHDRIERLFSERILKNFPTYSDFWEKFVGWRDKKRLLPYELEFPSTMTEEDMEEIRGIYNQICLTHYTCFHQCAGAHYQLERAKNLEETRTTENDDEAHFQFWEHYDNFYQHIGNGRNGMRKLWNLIAEFSAKDSPSKIEDYLFSIGEKKKAQKIQKLEDRAITLRNNLVHYSRTWHLLISGSYYIPLPIKEDPAFKDIKDPDEIKLVTSEMHDDLEKLEEILNDIVPIIGKELNKCLNNKGVKILRE
ncbi:hypothetical protein AKJ65_06180 [candidate division MSBL1 archaeon SCGC-AAA259E19]|uniref:Cthe-2314-like HEPN domain-containing protein n=1 Tax=candidate division MSBL1 archaeon SCGC-AAA259E19 TaxID=1698264 RepID=A0A133UHJ3_9EURY|nr:hypothetical protein AKJ65_06180 [candidate division MSBL1 archaeon SCGC-AAA259E19]